jgi:hypothetical protein
VQLSVDHARAEGPADGLEEGLAVIPPP